MTQALKKSSHTKIPFLGCRRATAPRYLWNISWDPNISKYLKDMNIRRQKSNGTQSQRRQLRHREWFHWYQLDIRPAGSTTHIYTGLVFGKLPAYGEVNGNIDCNWYQYQQKSSEMWTSSKKKLCTLTPMLPIRYFVISVHNPKCAKTPPNRKEAVNFDSKILSERGWGRFGFITILLVAILL